MFIQLDLHDYSTYCTIQTDLTASGVSFFVPGLPADIHISLEKRGRRMCRIELVGRRYGVHRDAKYSTKVPEATASQIAELIRRWLVTSA